MTLHSLSIQLARMGPIGNLKASGTIATLCATPLAITLSYLLPNPYLYGFFLLCSTLIGRTIINRACIALHNHDDSPSIVLDEIIGCLIVFWGILPSWQSTILGVALFRFFDISKIGGITYLERYPHGWGIILDDIAAGLASNLILRFLL